MTQRGADCYRSGAVAQEFSIELTFIPHFVWGGVDASMRGSYDAPTDKHNHILAEALPMKKAVIVVGPHFSGKSKTINQYFKPLIGLSENQRRFDLNQKPGFVLSQSLEEKSIANVKAFLSRYLLFQWLVLAARPSTEAGSHLDEIRRILNASGFSVHVVDVAQGQSESFYKARAQDIRNHLS